MTRKFHFNNGQTGAALAVRITPRASRNQIVGILNDGTIKVHLTAASDDETNALLVNFLADVLDMPSDRITIVAGESGRDKLVSLISMDTETAHQRILARVD